MKISKLFAITLQSKTRLIFFFVLATYNLLLGIYLKDFFVLSPMLTFIVTAIEMMYFGIVDNGSGKDKPLTKICVLVLTAFIQKASKIDRLVREILPTYLSHIALL